MAEQYTHDFKFQIGEDGSKFINGEIEFNSDGKVSFKIKDWAEPLLKEDLERFTYIVDHLKNILGTIP